MKTLSFDGIFEQKKLNTFGSTAFGGAKKATYSNGYNSSGYVSSGGTKDPAPVKKVVFNPNTGTNTYLPNASNANINGNGNGNGNSTTPTQVSYAMSSSIIKKPIVPTTPTPIATLSKKALKKEIRKEKLERRATETTDDEAFIPVRSKKNSGGNGTPLKSIDANKVSFRNSNFPQSNGF